MADIDPGKHFRAVLRSYPKDPQQTQPSDGQQAPEKEVSYLYELLSVYEPDSEPQIRIERVRGSDSAEITEMTAEAHPVEDPWVWSRFFKAPPGEEIRVTTTVMVDGQSFTIKTPAAGITKPVVSKSKQRGRIKIPTPRLVVAINTTAVRDPKDDAEYNGMDFANPGVKEFNAILQYIWARLVRGTGPAWLGPDGQEERFGLVPLNDESLDFGLHTAEELEEAWAQLVAEKLTGNPYAGPGLRYLGSHTHDKEIFAKLNDHQDPAYPLVAACQHLCTIAGSFRGFGFKGDGFDAMTSSAQTMKNLGGIWHPDNPITQDADVSLQNPVQNSVEKGLRPADNFLWCKNKTYPKVKGDHIAFILRIHRDGKRVQFFDTGGAGIQGGKGTIPGVSGLYEYPWATRFFGPSTFRGVGMFNQDAGLDTLTDRLRRTRPLGLARMVIRKRGAATTKDSLVYVSPTLRMYTNHAHENFAISRLAWSLRMMPGRDQLEGRWLVYTPRLALATAMMNSPRNTPMLNLVDSAKLQAKQDADKQLSAHQYVQKHSLALTDMFVNADGSIGAVNRLEVSSPNFDPHLPDADKSLPAGSAAGPDYFKGEWS